jgi:hypothetical protein
MQIAIPESAHAWLKQERDRQDRSINWLINRLIEEAQNRAAAEEAAQRKAPQ